MEANQSIASYRMETITVGGLQTAVVTRKDLAEIMVQDCMAARDAGEHWRPRLVFSSNGQGVVLAAHDCRFAAAMASADIVHADGMSIVFSSRAFASQPLPERVATTDFILDACSAAEKTGLSFFFLGGSEEDNARGVAWLKKHFPKLRVVGRHHGHFGEEEENDVIAAIRSLQPDVLWLGLGKPRQEYAALRYQALLPGVGWIKTCGGMLDYYSGRNLRAPLWIQRAGFEWLFRAIQEPRRLGKRYLTTNFTAMRLLITRTQ